MFKSYDGSAVKTGEVVFLTTVRNLLCQSVNTVSNLSQPLLSKIMTPAQRWHRI